MIIEKKDKTKEQLLGCLEKLKSEFAGELNKNEVNIQQITDGYSIKATKKILFLSFWVNAKIIAKNGEFELNWETNAPENKVNEAMKQIISTLEKC